MCCEILKFLYTLCLNTDPEILHFLIVENSIEMFGYIAERVGKFGKFTMEFYKYLFEIIELPTVLTSELKAIVPIIIIKLIFNMKIWSNSDYSIQKELLKRAHSKIGRAHV